MALRRKRSDSDAETEGDTRTLRAPTTVHLKKSRSQNDLAVVPLIAVEDAWHFDTTPLLPCLANGSGMHDNYHNYDHSKSLFVLCVVGGLTIHYTLLCNTIEKLLEISPNLQALLLCLDPYAQYVHPCESHLISLPAIKAVTPEANYFGKLGLLQPSGGGREALDALVVVDARCKRRLVLPFGWGAGRYVNDGAGGRMVQRQLIDLLVDVVTTLEREKASTVGQDKTMSG